MNEWVHLFAGGLLLYLGAEWLVGGAATLALILRIPRLLVGLTVVAYGTSVPEVVVGVDAAASGHGEVALGNVLGSNLANIGLVLGLAVLVRPARVDGSLGRRQLPVLVGSTALLPLLLVDDELGRVESIALVGLAVAYTLSMIRSARTASELFTAKVDAKVTEAAADVAGAPRASSIVRAVVTAISGLSFLLLGGHLFVGASVDLARSFGFSDRLVGLTLVAVGTSLPELVTSVLAARRRHTDLAIGNVVGSNIFNTLLCLGASGLAGPVGAPIGSLAPDFASLYLMTGLLAVIVRRERIVTRAEGAVALGLYLALTVGLASRG